MPPLFMPQGSNEMTAIANVYVDPELDFTSFMVLSLLESRGDEEVVVADKYGPGYVGRRRCL